MSLFVTSFLRYRLERKTTVISHTDDSLTVIRTGDKSHLLATFLYEKKKQEKSFFAKKEVNKMIYRGRALELN